MASSLGALLASMEHRINGCIDETPGTVIQSRVTGSEVDSIELEPRQACYEQKDCETYHVIYHDTMLAFATKLQQNKTSGKQFRLYNTLWEKFPDGTDNITLGAIGTDESEHDASEINSPTYFKGKNLLFVASFHSNDATMSQFHVIAHLCESFAKSLTVLLPFYSTATMERVDINHDGVVPTASTLARFFNGLPSMGYPIRLMTYDLHTLQNRFYLTGHTVASLHTATTLMTDVIGKMRRNTKGPTPIDSLAFPDAGARKRFGKLFKDEIKEEKTIVCEKVRNGEERKITVIEGNNLLASGTLRHILIVDDMINSGATLIECASVLREKGGKDLKISVYITHAIFNDKFFTSVNDGKFKIFHTIYTTDSVPNKITSLATVYKGKHTTTITIPREQKMKRDFDDSKINILVLPLAQQVVKDL